MKEELILYVIQTVIYLVLGGLVLWYKTNTELRSKTAEYIREAEHVYKDTVKSGGTKHKYVVAKLYERIPRPMKAVFTYEILEEIVDRAFDSIEGYARAQLDKAVSEPHDT